MVCDPLHCQSFLVTGKPRMVSNMSQAGFSFKYFSNSIVSLQDHAKTPGWSLEEPINKLQFKDLNVFLLCFYGHCLSAYGDILSVPYNWEVCLELLSNHQPAHLIAIKSKTDTNPCPAACERCASFCPVSKSFTICVSSTLDSIKDTSTFIKAFILLKHQQF